MKFIYMVVEGPHDIAAIGRILKLYNIKSVQNLEELNSFWKDKRLIPRDFPVDGHLLKRVPVPTFFQNEEISIAVHSSGGDSKIVKTLSLSLLNLDYEDLHAFAIFRDTDQHDITSLFCNIVNDLRDSEVPIISNVHAPGEIYEENNTKVGVFLFPDNKRQGTLETTLIEASNITYPNLLKPAIDYVDSVDNSYKSTWGISDKEKIIIGCIANVLKPGKSNQVSIQDNDWISEKTLDLEPIKKLNAFINQLIS